MAIQIYYYNSKVTLAEALIVDKYFPWSIDINLKISPSTLLFSIIFINWHPEQDSEALVC